MTPWGLEVASRCCKLQSSNPISLWLCKLITLILLQAQTEYHELILYPSCLHIVNRISQALVQELPFNSRTTNMTPAGIPLGFAEDIAAGLIFIYTGNLPLDTP